MSYDIKLWKDGKVVQLPEKHMIAGGTYALGGTEDVHFNITYNYAEFFMSAFGDEEGIKVIEGADNEDALGTVSDAFLNLKGLPDDTDYWKPTEGNARYALFQLINLMQLVKFYGLDGNWEIS